MKKLKNKVFFVLLSLLTLFLVSILFISNYQNYENQKKEIEKNLIGMDERRERKDINIEPKEFNNENRPNEIERPRIFMDSVVYTVLLGQNNEILDIISHTENGISNDEIKEIALNILNDSNKKDKKIGNLYIDNYSYSIRENMSMTIIDNTIAKQRLISILKTSIIIFICLEIIILIIAKKLTNWIIKPVIETFEKQKQFITDASHELKTPLAVIMASSELMEKDSDKKWLNNIKTETERMSNLITELLNLAKLENREEKKDYLLNDLTKTVEIAILPLEGLIFEKNISFDYKLQEGIKFNCDSEQIKQLVTILLDNAIKHSTENGDIKIVLEKQKNEILLKVTNKGEPTPKESEEKIFERFYRADESRNRNENRYGLGLSIAKNIVQNHNGIISAKSHEGYTDFTVVFKM